jgi:hypothetical protein
MPSAPAARLTVSGAEAGSTLGLREALRFPLKPVTGELMVVRSSEGIPLRTRYGLNGTSPRAVQYS